MGVRLTNAEQWVAAAYDSRSEDGAEFGEIVRSIGTLEPEELADVIEADGAMRLKFGLRIDLDRYLTSVPNLPQLAVAIDAAIDVCCRAAAVGGDKDPAAGLIRAHPDLAPQIRRSEVLGRLFAQTTDRPATPPSRKLPCDLGPRLVDGRCRYELRELLGFGSQGGVYLAVDRQLSEPQHPAWVAVKVLKGEASDTGEGEVWRYEASNLRRVAHPNVVRVLDRGVSPWREGFVVYDYVRGQTLRARAEGCADRIRPREVAKLVRDLARGAQAVHSAGLVHCDLKPDNVIVDSEGVPRITDFGVSAARQPGGLAGQKRCGSPAFMAPEQFRQEPGWVVPGADIYALGGILFWLLTGALPNGQSLAEIERNMRLGHREDEHTARMLARSVGGDLEAICRRAMAHDRSERYASAEMLAADLDSFLAHRPVSWRGHSVMHLGQLLLRRQPLAAAASILLVIVAITVAFASQHVIESKKRFALERSLAVETEKNNELETRNRERKLAVDSALYSIERMSAQGLGTEWLTVMSALEAMTGSVLLGDPSDPNSAWASRIQVAQELLQRARANGRGQDLESLVWESALSIWLVKADRPTEALELLERNQVAWAKKLEPGDRWLGRLGLVQACAEASAAIRSFRAGTGSEGAARSALQRLARTYESDVGIEGRDPAARLRAALLRDGHGAGLISSEF